MSWPWGHPVVLNKGPLDWESSTLATRPLFKGGRIVRQTTKTNMEGCLSFTCCFSWTLGSSSKCDPLKPFYRYYFGKCSSELAQRVLLPFSQGGILIILMHCMIFLSPVPDVARIYMLTVSFLTQLNLHTITIWGWVQDYKILLHEIFGGSHKITVAYQTQIKKWP